MESSSTDVDIVYEVSKNPENVTVVGKKLEQGQAIRFARGAV
jgi:hypothetical protein